MKPLLFMLPLCSCLAMAEISPKTKLISEVVEAKPLERVPPKYPVEAARKGQEGWVRLSFVVDEQGQTLDPVVIDSSGIKAFEKEALRALNRWQYSPAMQDGKPIQQCQMKLQLDFKLEGGGEGVRRKFRAVYVKANKALEAGDINKAKELVAKLKAAKQWNMYENSWFWMLDAQLAAALKDSKRELNSLRRSTMSNVGDKYLGTGNYLLNLQRIFVLEIEDVQYAEALETYKEISEHEKGKEMSVSLEKYAQQLASLLQGDTPLVKEQEINERGIFLHRLSRSQFALADIKGELNTLDIRCDNHRTKYTVAEDTTWQIPVKWGTCHVLFEGDKGTRFKVVELQKTSA